MQKITVFLALALACLVASHPAEAEKSMRIRRIGLLTPRSPSESASWYKAFRNGLRELGWIEGKNISIEFRQGNRTGYDSYLGLAKELVRIKVDLILAVGVTATRAAKKATQTIPIVMGNSSVDPVRHGLIASLARPGGNVTGVIDLLPDLAGKRLEVLKEIFPKLTRVAHLSPAPGTVGPAHLRATIASARTMGVRVQALEAKHPGDLESAFRAAAEGGAEALIVVGVSFFIPHMRQIVDLESKYRLPAMHTHSGGLVSYRTDRIERWRRAAQYVDKIFRGAKPADLPVEQPRKFDFVINLRTAKALGITVPPEVLLRATKVIR